MLDSFETHKTEQVKRSFKSENTALTVIPGGLSSVLQPLDVCLNKPFKDRVRQKWMACIAQGIHELTAGGCQKKTIRRAHVSVEWRSVARHSKRNGCKVISKVRNYKFLRRLRRRFYI